MTTNSSANNLIELCFRRGWTDGLPVVPPTRRSVDAMISGAAIAPETVVGEVPPRNGMATVEIVAANAVMAGCLPEHFPIVLAATGAILDPVFNLNGIQATTHCCSPLVVVTGPIVEELGFNAKAGCFGSGNRANAAVGRAIRLIMSNVGGAFPGTTDQATFGHPGKFSYCIAERNDGNPWTGFAQSRGYPGGPGEVNSVTVFAAEAPHHVNDHVNRVPHRIADSIADTMSTYGNNNTWFKGEVMVVVGPSHAQSLAASGWSREDLQYYLFKQAGSSIGHLQLGGRWSEETLAYWPKWVDTTNDETHLPIVNRPEDILIVVAGGDAGLFSAVVPGWGNFGTKAVTRLVG